MSLRFIRAMFFSSNSFRFLFSNSYFYFKSFADRVVAFIFLLLLLPLLLLVALLVRLFLGSPVIFTQTRPGYRAKPFSLMKFRSMNDLRTSNGLLLPDNKRLTRFGRFLRATSLDELPELFNILRGEMSFVGPRPLLMEYIDFYTDEESIRHNVKPGLTGLAQISGRNLSTWDYRLSMDVYYVKNLSFSFDLFILIKTFFQVLRRKDVVVNPSSVYVKLSTERSI